MDCVSGWGSLGVFGRGAVGSYVIGDRTGGS